MYVCGRDCRTRLKKRTTREPTPQRQNLVNQIIDADESCPFSFVLTTFEEARGAPRSPLHLPLLRKALLYRRLILLPHFKILCTDFSKEREELKGFPAAISSPTQTLSQPPRRSDDGRAARVTRPSSRVAGISSRSYVSLNVHQYIIHSQAHRVTVS